MDNPSFNQNGIEYNGEQIAYKDSTYELVSKVAYLIGVPLRIFQNEHEPPKIEIYNRLEQDKNARIIRNLCIIRTAIERNYRKINDIMRMEYRGLLSMPEIIPASSMQQLSNDGINFIKKSSTKLCHHIIEINRLISLVCPGRWRDFSLFCTISKLMRSISGSCCPSTTTQSSGFFSPIVPILKR